MGWEDWGDCEMALERQARGMIPPAEEWRELSPDKRPSSADLQVVDRGRETFMLMEVHGHGVLCMRCTTGHSDGKLHFEGVSSFTNQQLLLENEIDDPNAKRLE